MNKIRRYEQTDCQIQPGSTTLHELSNRSLLGCGKTFAGNLETVDQRNLHPLERVGRDQSLYSSSFLRKSLYLLRMQYANHCQSPCGRALYRSFTGRVEALH